MLQDLRYALRQFVRSPGHTVTIVLILALGIGANTAIFSLLHSVLLKPLPYPEPERLMFLRQRYQSQRDVSISWPSFQDWHRDNRSFAALGVGQRDSYALTGRGSAERLDGAGVSAEFFQATGLPPLFGRVFTPEEDRVGGPPVVVLSQPLWQRLFAGSPGALGQALVLNGVSYTIIGVMPQEMAMPRNAAFWIPIAPLSNNAIWQDRGNNPGLFALGRLKPGVSLEQARADLRAIGERINRDFPAQTAGHLPYIEPLLDTLTKNYRGGLWLLFGAVGLLLLVACTNVASLQVARGLTRERELSIRAALGSSRPRLLRQLLTENILVALCGGAVGIALAYATLGLIRALSPAVPRFQAVEINTMVLLFSAGAAGLTGLLSGLWPAWRASRVDLRTALQTGGLSGATVSANQWTRQLLVTLQVALTVTLLAGAALFARSLANIQAFPFGFDSRQLLIFRVELSGEAYNDHVKRTAFYDALKLRLAALPGVKSVGFNLSLPLRSHWDSGFDVEGRPPYPPNARPSMEVGVADADFFQTLGLPLLRGRYFDATDKPDSPRRIIIDQRMADEIWPGEDPIGKAILWGDDPKPEARRTEVIGVVPTVGMYGYEGEKGAKLYQLYFAQSQFRVRELYAVIRTSGEPRGVLEPARAAVGALDPNVPIYEVSTMEELISVSASSPRLLSQLLGGFSALALVLAGLGLYGVVAHAVRARQREIGIRMALGALQRQVSALVLRQGLAPLLAGLLFGLLGALGGGRLVAGMLFHVSPFDPVSFGAVGVILPAVAILALWLPARRAARVDPLITLRAD